MIRLLSARIVSSFAGAWKPALSVDMEVSFAATRADVVVSAPTGTKLISFSLKPRLIPAGPLIVLPLTVAVDPCGTCSMRPTLPPTGLPLKAVFGMGQNFAGRVALARHLAGDVDSVRTDGHAALAHECIFSMVEQDGDVLTGDGRACQIDCDWC